MHRLSTARRTPLALLLSAGLLVGGVGCSGHGTHTQAHKEKAQEKLAQMKSATEWDMARQSFVAGDLDKALRHVDRSIALNESVTKSHVLRGRILMEMGNFEAAISSFEKAQELDESNVDAHYYMGLAHERISRHEEALEHYTRATELDTDNAQYAVAAAEMMIDLGRVSEAKVFLTDREAQFKHNAGVRQTLGHIAMLQGQPEQAVELFSEARVLAPEDLAMLEDLTRAEIETGRFADAEYNLGLLLSEEENRGRRDLMQMRARCLTQLDRPMEARDILLTLTSDGPGSKDVRAWTELGHVSYILGDLVRLRQCGARVTSMAPASSDGFVLTALWQRSSGDLAGARKSMEQAVVRRGKDTAPLILLGIIAQEMGDTQKAQSSFALAVKENPGDASARQLLNSLSATGFATATEGDSPR